jgi:hypothetical protein
MGVSRLLFDRAKEIVTISHRERKSAMMIELPEKLEAALKVESPRAGFRNCCLTVAVTLTMVDRRTWWIVGKPSLTRLGKSCPSTGIRTPTLQVSSAVA